MGVKDYKNACKVVFWRWPQRGDGWFYFIFYHSYALPTIAHKTANNKQHSHNNSFVVNIIKLYL